MASTTNPASQYLHHVRVDSTTDSSIHLSWSVKGDSTAHIQGYQVHFQKVATSYIQYSAMLSSMTTSYKIRNLMADTFYKVCVVMYRNDTQSGQPPRQHCTGASTTSWHLPVSVGSSIGAMLALSLIVLMVLVARCPMIMRRRKGAAENGKYDSMTSNLHDDHLEMSDTTLQVQDDPFSDQDSIIVEVPIAFHEQAMAHHRQSLGEALTNANQCFYLSTTPPPGTHVPAQTTPIPEQAMAHHRQSLGEVLTNANQCFYLSTTPPPGTHVPAQTTPIPEQAMAHHRQSLGEALANANQCFYLSTTPPPSNYVPTQTTYVPHIHHVRPLLQHQGSICTYEGCIEELPHCSHMHSTVVNIEPQPPPSESSPLTSLDQNNPL